VHVHVEKALRHDAGALLGIAELGQLAGLAGALHLEVELPQPAADDARVQLAEAAVDPARAQPVDVVSRAAGRGHLEVGDGAVRAGHRQQPRTAGRDDGQHLAHDRGHGVVCHVLRVVVRRLIPEKRADG
jgi:hypothetical protein